MPIHRGGTGRCLAKVDPLMVTKCDQSFDMAVVKKPTPGDDVMVEVRKPHHEFFDPGAEIVPLPASLGHREIRPIERAGYLVEVGRSLGFEQLGQGRRARPPNRLAPSRVPECVP